MTQQWKLVPIEPTPQMVNAALKISGIFPQYAAMLAVAPVPAVGGDQEVRRIVTEALLGMISAVVSATPPPNAPMPDFIQAPVDRAVTRIGEHVTRLQAENAALQQRLNEADQRVDDLQHERSQILEVNQHSLRAVLTALVGAPHEIRELQACRGLPDNAIDQLLREYNAWIDTPAPAKSPQ